MSKLQKMDNNQYLFGSIFITSNRIDTIMEREFAKYGITTKQWFLSIIIDNLFEDAPSIKDTAHQMGTSHQNVKQIALKLQQKGLLALKKDETDSRTTRLELTKSAYDFWKRVKEESSVFTQVLFKDIDKDELAAARKVMEKILSNIDKMDINGVGVEKYE